jgi:prepilin-type N-terminal cleavage/methylation domain-containing protein
MKRGFTLLEILLVIAAIGILAAIVIVAINPLRQLGQARNAGRASDIRTIQQSLEQYSLFTGAYPIGITEDFQEVCRTDAVSCTGLLDLSVLVPDYVARLPIDPQVSNPNGTGYEVAINPINNEVSVRSPLVELDRDLAINGFLDCPNGYVWVPGNPLYNTNDFCVMQYEAKNSGGAVSQPSGTPYPAFGLTTAQSFCEDAPSGRRVINNNEWMTIARNLESVGSNWTTGVVGSGALYRGLSDGVGPFPLEVSNPSDPYSNTNSSVEQRRTLSLTNGQVIWDFSGNAYEIISPYILGEDKPLSSSPFSFVEWTLISNYGGSTYDDFRPSNSSWNSSQNMGQYEQGSNSIGSEYIMVRGGSILDTSEAGIYYLSTYTLSFAPPLNSRYGTRCVIIP